MRILFVSASPLRREYSIGNTFLNLFADEKNVEMASVYTKGGLPEKGISEAFLISEKMILKNILKRNTEPGERIPQEKIISQTAEHIDNQYFRKDTLAFFHKHRWTIFFWLQDVLWETGKWKTKKIEEFVCDYRPDVIFTLLSDTKYLNQLILHIKKISNAPLIVYAWDNNYSYRIGVWSPFRYIDRFINRIYMRKLVNEAECLYVISETQKEEYEQIFTPPCKILTKSADFSKEAPQWPAPEETVRLLYAGNLGAGRWKSLALIAEAVERLNNEGYSVALDTYTATPQTAKMQKALNRPGCRLHGAVSYAQVLELQKTADVLIHAEGLSLKSRLAVHQSFSTKLVDYFAFGKCIFAVGTPDVASIRHLLDNDAAIVASNHKDVYAHLKKILDEPEMIPYYGKQAYACGAKCHNKATMQTMLMEDLRKVVEKNA